MTARRGASVVEALVALLLGLFLVHLGLETVLRMDRFQERWERRHEALLSSRIARSVLRGELARSGGAWSSAGDSLRLRASRGTGVVCDVGPAADELLVSFRGDRYGDPTKDSVELVTDQGDITVLALRSSAPAATPCAVGVAGEEARVWRVEGAVPPDVVLARNFEVGSYHLAGSALRYRLGGGGRQPLTPQVWEDAGTRLASVDSALVLELAPRPGYGSSRSDFLWWLAR